MDLRHMMVFSPAYYGFFNDLLELGLKNVYLVH